MIGSTGFVGGHLAQSFGFQRLVHRSDIDTVAGLTTDLLVCAGLPADKWRANLDPSADWANLKRLAKVIATVRAERAVLISTVDVYQPPVQVDERHAPAFDGVGAYGTHRAWFESFFQSRFGSALIIRLPGLFAANVKKNLVHDLIHGKSDQWTKVNANSTFQFFDVSKTWSIIEYAWQLDLLLLNVATEPVAAHEVAKLFGVQLAGQGDVVTYDMHSIHARSFGGRDAYLVTRQEVLDGIAALRSPS